MRPEGKALTTSGCVLALCVSCNSSSSDCSPVTYLNQCEPRTTMWSAVGYGDGGTADSGVAMPNGCPSIDQLTYELVTPYALGLNGGVFVDGPKELGATCCYTTRSAPCE